MFCMVARRRYGENSFSRLLSPIRLDGARHWLQSKPLVLLIHTKKLGQYVGFGRHKSKPEIAHQTRVNELLRVTRYGHNKDRFAQDHRFGYGGVASIDNQRVG